MRVQWGISNQDTRLQRLLKEIDTEWESLTRSIEADRAVLNTIQPRLEHLRRQLALTPGAAIDTSPALAAHLKMMEQQAERLRQIIQLKEQERRALERYFDEARLAVAAQRQRTIPQGLQRHYTNGKSVLSRPFVCLLRGFRKSLHHPPLRNENVSRDSPPSNTPPVNGVR
jgi:DNA repair exonuclease SbcCD ATPase subunit